MLLTQQFLSHVYVDLRDRMGTLKMKNCVSNFIAIALWQVIVEGFLL